MYAEQVYTHPSLLEKNTIAFIIVYISAVFEYVLSFFLPDFQPHDILEFSFSYLNPFLRKYFPLFLSQ